MPIAQHSTASFIASGGIRNLSQKKTGFEKKSEHLKSRIEKNKYW